jgi:uncharacterized iron-regulated membrane protein
VRQFRTILFWCHLATGVTVAAVVLTMSVTGVLLTYQRQMTAWADTRGLDGGAPTPGARRLPVDSLLARVQRAAGGSPTAITWRAGREAPVEVAFGRERTLFVNAYTGAVVGEGARGVRAFFRTVTDVHRWLAASDERRKIGRSITGAANLGFLFLVMSGFYLWWPRNWTRAALRNVGLFRRGLSGRARDFNWHNVIGLWSVVPLFVIVLSGVVISYPWASNLVYRAVGEAPPPRGGPGAGAGRPGGEGGAPALAQVDALLARAGQRLPGWRSITLQLAPSADGSVTFSLDRGTGGQPQERAQLTLDPATGRDVRWEPFGAQSPGRRLRSVLRFAHTGEVLGIAGQTIAGLVSLGAAVLVWTGLALTWRRLRSWRGRRAAAGAARQRHVPLADGERVA